MTDQAVKKQIHDIKKITAQVVRSKETAREFLLYCNILKPETKVNPKKKK